MSFFARVSDVPLLTRRVQLKASILARTNQVAAVQSDPARGLVSLFRYFINDDQQIRPAAYRGISENVYDRNGGFGWNEHAPERVPLQVLVFSTQATARDINRVSPMILQRVRGIPERAKRRKETFAVNARRAACTGCANRKIAITYRPRGRARCARNVRT